MNFATLSQDSIKIFQYNPNASKYVEIFSKNDETRGGYLSWSGDGKWLISSSYTKGNLPIYKLIHNKLIPMRTLDVAPQQVISATFFNMTNRYLAFGSNDGAIAIWDIKERKTLSKFAHQGTNRARILTVSADDLHLAAVDSDSSKIRIFGVQTLTELKSLDMKKEHITGIQMAPKKNLLGNVTSEGATCVWDLYRSSKVFYQKNSHLGTVSSLSFCEQSSSLLASSSLAKTIKLFDLKSPTNVIAINADFAISSIDFLNSDSLLAGTLRGRLLRYDLRQTKNILEEIPAHNGTVLSVKVAKSVPQNFNEVAVDTPDSVNPVDKSFHRISLLGTPLLDLTLADVVSPLGEINDEINKVSRATISVPCTEPVKTSSKLSISEVIGSPNAECKKEESPLLVEFSPFTGVLASTPNNFSNNMRERIEKQSVGCQTVDLQEEEKVKKEQEVKHFTELKSLLDQVKIQNEKMLDRIEAVENSLKETKKGSWEEVCEAICRIQLQVFSLEMQLRGVPFESALD